MTRNSVEEDNEEVEVDENETPESIADAIMKAKDSKNLQQLQLLRAKERLLLIKEVKKLRSEQKDKENAVEKKNPLVEVATQKHYSIEKIGGKTDRKA